MLQRLGGQKGAGALGHYVADAAANNVTELVLKGLGAGLILGDADVAQGRNPEDASGGLALLPALVVGGVDQTPRANRP